MTVPFSEVLPESYWIYQGEDLETKACVHKLWLVPLCKEVDCVSLEQRWTKKEIYQ